MSSSQAPGSTAARVLVGLGLDGIGADGGAAGVAALADAATRADALGFDFVALDDPLARVADGGPRLSAVDALAFVARRTSRVALLASASSHYAEPFHVAKAIATLDFASAGRAGLLLDPARSATADRFFPAATDLDAAGRAAQAVEFAVVLGDLWDSWEDGAEIREIATGRYVDNAKIHHIDHDGRYFRVKGPLITPRPPQGRPPVFLADEQGAARLSAPATSDDRSPSGVPPARIVRTNAGSAAGLLDEVARQTGRLDPERTAGSGTTLLRVTVPAGLLSHVLGDLERSPAALPGATTPSAPAPTFASRLGLPWQPSRFAKPSA
ncbi:LLM class flavin-dependent oxidoreductase [Herbiconiux daphne]|uniref:LLM class flavin-dependent oxidoreductase n=1 Tax=Herbiconiux daphne TaxID=2970914 RepID=A0ABT2H5G6_9MICO|nr:LLM class flavin-dependent oxidoreductase [Herbiconiux daphne]MCS5735187.1 LLM class flavin-dependent oxidoreductase [Herbiconiux daphne]